MGFENSWHWARSQYKERYANTYRGYMLKAKSTKIWKNIDALFAYKKIYENLGTAGLPLLHGKSGMRKQMKAQLVKHGLMLTSGIFFFAFTRLGMFNKIFFWLVTSQSIVFVHKCNFYQGVIDDLATAMTLSGQEARIQVRFSLPDHPQEELYTQLCTEYKKLSVEQLQKHRDQVDLVAKSKKREKDLDAEFARRLAQMDEADDELPRNRVRQ